MTVRVPTPTARIPTARSGGNSIPGGLSSRLVDAATRLASDIAQAVSGARLTVLIFHRVLAEQDPLSPSTPDAARFERAMDLLRRCFHVVPLDHALSRLATGDLPPRCAAITFDDGYADNYTVAAPILERLGLTATFFVATGFLDGGRMWNDTVIESVRRFRGDVLDLMALGLGRHMVGTVPERNTTIDRLLGQLKYLEMSRRDELTAAIADHTQAPLPDGLMMTSAQVKSLFERGMTIGAHTVNHPILVNISERAAEDEIQGSKAMLDALLSVPVKLFAYPNGKPFKDYDRRHVEIVRRGGFLGAVSTATGAAPARADPYQIPRFTPWAVTAWRYSGQLVRNLRHTQYPVAR